MTNRIRNFTTAAQPTASSMAVVPAALQNAPMHGALQDVYKLARQQALASVERRQWHELLRRLLECDE
jgi:hypothetical protein